MAKKIKCISCGKQIKNNHKFCEYCGALVTEENNIENKQVLTNDTTEDVENKTNEKGFVLSTIVKTLLFTAIGIIAILFATQKRTELATEKAEEVVSEQQEQGVTVFEVPSGFEYVELENIAPEEYGIIVENFE